jgi:hypothetical protein
MPNNIHESLLSLAVDIDKLLPLEGNPRKGNVDAIAASYLEFGQVRPIVIRPNDDGTSTVIAGNHQLEAARRLGWDRIAAVQYDVDNARAIAFAIADNRTMELGYTEPELLNELILEIHDVYPDLLDDLGWDQFDLAELEQTSIREDVEVVSHGAGFVAPVLVAQPGYGRDDEDDVLRDVLTPSIPNSKLQTVDSGAFSITRDQDGNQQINIRSDIGTNQNDAVVRGATTITPSAHKAVVQYTIVFDDTDQQMIWYDFVRHLRSNPEIVGATTAEKLITFISMHTPLT